MKFCQDHWDRLRQAIENVGLKDLICENAQEATLRLAANRPDPLMAAHHCLVQFTIDQVGVEPFLGQECCPLCYMIQTCPCNTPGCKDRLESLIPEVAGFVKSKYDELPKGTN